MADARSIRAVDMHTAGEPVRIFEDGFPEPQGATILEKRRDALERFDEFRQMLMFEPRGHAGMYGVIPVIPSHPAADLAVLFTHQEGYSTMCGHATIAVGRWAIDSKRVARAGGTTRFTLEVPCGLVPVEVTDEPSSDVPRVAFESVPSFASHLDHCLKVDGLGDVRFDIAFGGAYYAILRASRIGLSFAEAPLPELVSVGVALTNAVRAAVPIVHPTEPDLGFLYGTIITDDVAIGGSSRVPSSNLCIFADGQIDRSPTGSGVTARIALAAAKGQMTVGDCCEIRGVSGEPFHGELVSHETASGLSRVRVSGRSYYSAKSLFISERDDPFASGFTMPSHFKDLD